MKKFNSLFVALFLALSTTTHAAWDIFQTYVVIDRGSGNEFYAGSRNADAATQWETTNGPFFSHLGRYTTGGSLILRGGETKTFKNGGSDVCEGRVFYRVYRNCDAPGAFQFLTLPFSANLPAPGDQRWQFLGGTGNLISGLTLPGTYVFEVYWEQLGHDSSIGSCSQSRFDSNSGNNFKAYFEFNTNDSFTDFNITSGPTWTGDVAAYGVVNTSDVAGLLTSDLNRSRTLRLNATGTNTQSIATQIATWDAQQEWFFWMGRRNQAVTNANRSMVWLYANESNLESATVDGYRLVIGDDSGVDEIRIERVDNGTPTTIYQSVNGVTNGIVNWGLAVRVVRTQSGRWSVRTSTLPTASGSGATARSCVETLATILQGNSLNAQNFADDNTYVPAANSFIGISTLHSSATDALVGAEYDNFRFLPVPPDTYVQFVSGSGTVNENVAGGTFTIPVAITNPAIGAATTVQVVLTSGDPARVNNYTTQTLTFPAGNPFNQNLVLNITDNNLCDDLGIITFTLQNVTGGVNAYINTPNTYTLTIVDDNSGYETILVDDFEDGNINGWTPVSAGTWQASTTAPASGTTSLRHVNSGAAGQAHVFFNTDGAVISGVTTTWRFNLKTFNREPSPANKWQVFLSANNSNLWGTEVDGYALGVNPNVSGDLDILTLWRVENGVMSVPIITTSLDWGIAQNEVGFEVELNEAGLWTLSMDANGDFDNLVAQGTGTDITYDVMDFFGARFIHTLSIGGELALDDVRISQQGCRFIYYSRANGDVDDAIWSTQPTGLPAPTAIIPNRYTRLVIQNGHTVAVGSNFTSDDILIESGGIMNGGVGALRVHGNWANFGTYVPQTGTVILRGSAAQTIGGTSVTRFHNLTIDNDFGTVTANGPFEVQGHLSIQEATFQTNNHLTLFSDASNSGYIGPINLAAGADIVGNVTLQRYIPAANQNWVYLSCPIPGRSIADWNDDLILTGFPGSDFPSYNFISVYNYDETVGGSRNNGWIGATNVTNGLNAQRGYIVYMTGAANTVDVTGSIQKGAVSVPMFFTNTGSPDDGWNLMSNVYPAPIDWVALEGNSANVGSYFVFDSQLPGYRSYNANSQFGSASRYIAHSQSFFVKASATNQFLNFLESHKTTQAAPFERSEVTNPSIRFRIERNGEADECGVVFVEGATDNYEPEYDAEKLESTVLTSPELALVSADNMLLTIDARPSLTQAVSIPIYLDLPAAGTYTFRVLETVEIPLGTCITIEDTVTGESITATADAEMTITTSAAYQGNRLMIYFTAPVNVSTQDALCFDEAGMIDVQGTSTDSWSIVIRDGMGATVYEGTTAEDVEVMAGQYVVEVQNTSANCAASTVTVNITEPEQTLSTYTFSADECNQNANGSIEATVLNADFFSYTLSNSAGVAEQGESTASVLSFEDLVGDMYTLTVETACATIEQQIDLRDENAVTATVGSSSSLLQIVEGTTGTITFSALAPNATNFVWTVNAVQVSTAISFEQTFAQAGVYTIGLTASNESCSTTASTQVEVETVVSLDEVAEQETVTIVPLAEGLQVNFTGENAAASEIRIYSMSGQLVNIQSGRSQQVWVDTQGLSSGVYTVQVWRGSHVLATQSFVK
jgi:hypothetical protein